MKEEIGLEESEIKSWKKRLIWSWIFTVPIVFLMYFDKITGVMIFEETQTIILSLIFAFFVIFIIGFQTIKLGFRAFYTFYFNMDSLIALGTVVAYLTGILQFVFEIQDYSGISAMIMSIFITGKYIESVARGKAGKEIRKLIELGAKNARVLRSGKELEIPISDVKIGDILIIKPGEKIPTDGVVIKGESSVNESMITGESLPIDKKKGSNVIGATINQYGVLYVKVTKVGEDTFLAHIINLVEEAQSSKIPIQKLADKITNIFVPAILVLAVLTFFGWYLFGEIGKGISAAISVLVIACPCALGLATPIALTVSSGIGAKNGILVRKGEAIQTMKEIKFIVFDKTGTITKGEPEVKEFYSLIDEKKFVSLAASLERLSEHPIAKAVVKKADLKKYFEVKNFRVISGKGVEGSINGKKIIIGNERIMKDNNISIEKLKSKISELENKGYTVMIVSESKKVIGIIGVADSLKEDSQEAIDFLNKQGYKTVMITGDNERTANYIAKQVGINKVIANVLPEDKSNEVKKLQINGKVAFVGDGINDAPALKNSNVGIAMGNGTDIAIEAGDIVLTNGSLIGVVKAINLSRVTFSKIKQNLFWAFAYNVIAIPLAVFGVLHPIIAEIAMASSSITVVTNANLLRRKKI